MKKALFAASVLTLLAGCSCTNNNNSRPASTCTDDSDQSADWQITSKVKASLMSDSSLSASGKLVSVETNDGVVTLTGTVPSKDESRYIERKVKAMDGVKRVDNQLTISP
jgi:hyperosmotically inducible protein